MKKIRYLPLDHYLNLLGNSIPFAFSRWGDGELSAVFGVEGKNCDGHVYYPRLGDELRNVLYKHAECGEHYYYGILPCGYNAFPDELKNLENQPEWVDGNVIMHANRNGEMREFWEMISNYRVAFVGPARLVLNSGRMGFFDIKSYIPTLLINTYARKEEIEWWITCEMIEKDINLILFCAGMMTKVLIYNLWGEFSPYLTLIDLGSMLDPYTNIMSRKYMVDYDWNKLKEQNRPCI